MNTYIRIFLKKFLAAISLNDINNIPFSGDKFQNGIEAVEIYLRNNLDPDTYDLLSEMFVKTPVQEVYNQIRDMFMDLNGDTIKFSAVENPYWTNITISIDSNYASFLLNNNSYLKIDKSIVTGAANEFLERAGVIQWAQY